MVSYSLLLLFSICLRCLKQLGSCRAPKLCKMVETWRVQWRTIWVTDPADQQVISGFLLIVPFELFYEILSSGASNLWDDMTLLETLQENSDALGAHVPRVSVGIVDKSATRHEPTHTAMPWNSSWSRHSGRTADSRPSQVPQTWPSVDPWQTSQAESDVQQQP